jgi:tetratricopeptide (TPR) repeat protein
LVNFESINKPDVTSEQEVAVAADRWSEVRGLVEAAMALHPAERLTYITAQATNAEVGEEARQLLGFDCEASKIFSIDGWKLESTLLSNTEATLDGTMLGNYRLLTEIGRGGMGTVYLAERADGLYQHQIAIKILQEGLSSPALIARFSQERQLLAQLSHPGICRLLDGGATPEGRPYLALEYVNGRPIDLYCEEEACSITERLRLFLKVASAVQAAHQQLILHLDIKPGNVLVTQEGEPRLLDFGIARAVSESGPEPQEGKGYRVLTPRYASPEQSLNQPLTVASDVFSLGLLLHKMLTGVLPKASSAAYAGIPKTSRVATPLPSEIHCSNASQLRGDLDCILLQATCEDPQRRYQTVASFADDVERHLQLLPVHAHRDNFAYRAGKFFRRNRITALVSAAALLILVVSAVSVVKAAVVARRERATAERRLAENRTLAHSYIFDLPRQLQDIPGTVEVRHGIVEQALKYLEAMSAEANSDPSLDQDLAAGFYVIGQLQGGSTLPSLGDQESGLRSLTKGMAIQQRISIRNPKDLTSQARVMMANTAIANIHRGFGDIVGAEQMHQASFRMGQPILAAGPAATSTRMYEVASAAWFIGLANTGDGSTWSLADPAQALPWFERAQQILERWFTAYPQQRDSSRARSFFINLLVSTAEALRELDRQDEARIFMERAVAESDRKPVLFDSLSLSSKRDSHLAYAHLLLDEGDVAGAIRASADLRPEEMREMREKGANSFTAKTEIELTSWFAILDMRTGHKSQGRRELTRSFELAHQAERESPQLAELVGAHATMLIDLADLPDTTPADDEPLYREALSMAQQYGESHPGVLSSKLLAARACLGLARVEQLKHHSAEARTYADQAVSLLTQVTDARPGYPLPHQLLKQAITIAGKAAAH